jgi:hypothetical protein
MDATYVSTLIVGMGPSAIQLALHLKDPSFLLIDKGPLDRDHSDGQNATKGFGGAALFSDGKYPKKPAGTAVWNLKDKGILDEAYEECKQRVKDAGLEWGSDEIRPVSEDKNWQLKPYDCIYVPLEIREGWMKEAKEKLAGKLIPNAVVYKIQKSSDGTYMAHYQNNGDWVNTRFIHCRNLVLATGRFSLTFIEHPFPTRFLRTEVGVRIQCAKDHPCWTQFPETDSKFSLKKGDKEWRTFCQIEDGEVVCTRFSGVQTHSGRADVPSTGLSNIGFNFRTTRGGTEAASIPLDGARPFNVSWEELKQIYGYTDVVEGLEEFFKAKPLFDPSVMRFIGPTIEGVGWYPVVDANLKIHQENVWCIGDCAGTFRGWTPAEVSGHYVAEMINEARVHKVLNRIRDDHQYLLTSPPSLISANEDVEALHEIHIFLEPLNPDEEEVSRFELAVQEWNLKHPGAKKPMKACLLALEFKEHGWIRVMQSSRYVLSNDKHSVVKECHADAQYFCEWGFDVSREKIEATADGILGIPLLDQDATKWPGKYFEFHIRVERTDKDEMTEEEQEILKNLSDAFTEELGVPVPLSYNALKGLDGKKQKYLNLRVRSGLGMADQQVREVIAAIKEKGLRVVKTIREYVWYDSYTLMDKGWIDF